MCGCNAADCFVIEERLCIAPAAQREPALQHGTVLRDMIFHSTALMIGMCFILQKRGLDRCRINYAVEVFRLIVVGQADSSV